MSRTRSRSDSIREDEELRLPRPPGVLRRFWARHPVVADVMLTILCILLSLTPAARLDPSLPEPFAFLLSVLGPTAVVLACATLLWRRRVPLLPAVTAYALEMLFLFSVFPGGSPLLLVAAYSLAVYSSSRLAWITYAGGLTVLFAVGALLWGTGAITLQSGSNAVLAAVVLGLIGTLIGVNVGNRKRYLDAVIARSRQLLVERDQQAQLAAAAERARIAREMHDIVSHSLTVIVALSEGAAATPDRDQARAAASTAADTARSALTEMRLMLGVLRDDDAPLPLAPAQPVEPRDTVAAAQRAGYPVTLAVSGSADLPPATAHAVGRIVQEGVTNAMRHAPGATAVRVRIDHGADSVRIDIRNDGVSGQVGSEGFGLRGLSERAAHARGTLQSGPTGPGSWLLRAELPLTADASAQHAAALTLAPTPEEHP
ncbi:sensor histidine kinase [Microbacterium sp. p3-SID336]|uniref:sensor histidine kinase n=1 Tax=Microbacterium sp. p3-SID336 TaxID=2916212 RepID=UPI0021A5D2D8|nr:histidine kinase [Microbacterium sp. p3-SID336]MCT1479314.1 histidine kinase [Microbacterium sp. p3-SID336]